MASSQPNKPNATAGDDTAALSTYRAKRDATKTPEPMGTSSPRKRRSQQQPTFVIQEHHARALHWDFRLEHDGVLVSWALPKGLPEDPSKNHLAVHTEDHPLEYGSFEGGIPRGEYGGGQVAIWDHGTYDLEKWTEREVKVVLHGERSSGRYVLFRTGGKNWMIHRMDPPPEGYEPMPERVEPMLPESGSMPTDDRGWAYEFEWDGIRAIVFVDGGRARAIGHHDHDLTTFFPELRDIGERLGARSAVLDGEIVAFDETGVTNVGRVQHRLEIGTRSAITRRARDEPTSYLAFDLLYLEGRSLLEAPYDERRERLDVLGIASASFTTPPSIRDRAGVDVLEAARESGLGGIVAKRRSSPYRPGSRSGDWIKIKTSAR
jgi:bifunctional non-homologous end joining protein LigD